jgi:hypothetical protein
MSRFGNLKKKSPEEWVENADVPVVSVEALPKPQRHLVVFGRLPDNAPRARQVAFRPLESVWEEIKSSCEGGDQAILNYLLRRGLASLKAESTTVILNAGELT